MWVDHDEVHRLRSVYNKEHPREKPIPHSNAEKEWKEIQKRLHNKCKTGRPECIVSALLQRPRAPKSWALNRLEWLSSDDIDAVEKNYAELFPDYEFMGCVPIDFDLKSETGQCIVSTLCSTNLKKMFDAGRHRIGIVFNTDPHDGPGEHWIALFADMRPELAHPRITYFDSYAQSPEKEIKVLMRRWKAQLDAMKIHPNPTKLTYNKTRHQFKDSECGMYCLYFHYACLTGISMKENIPDDVMNSFRNLLFRMPKIES